MFDLEITNNYIIAGTHTKGVFRFPLSELTSTGINDFQVNENNKLMRIVDILGREQKGTNQLLFYLYNDGTVEKKVVIE